MRDLSKRDLYRPFVVYHRFGRVQHCLGGVAKARIVDNLKEIGWFSISFGDLGEDALYGSRPLSQI
jgi:hypothetical protein